MNVPYTYTLSLYRHKNKASNQHIDIPSKYDRAMNRFYLGSTLLLWPQTRAARTTIAHLSRHSWYITVLWRFTSLFLVTGTTWTSILYREWITNCTCADICDSKTVNWNNTGRLSTYLCCYGMLNVHRIACTTSSIKKPKHYVRSDNPWVNNPFWRCMIDR